MSVDERKLFEMICLDENFSTPKAILTLKAFECVIRRKNVLLFFKLELKFEVTTNLSFGFLKDFVKICHSACSNTR